jgi:hypothetical protein
LATSGDFTSAIDSRGECYEHDARHRLVEAFTVDISDDCATGEPGGGDQPYERFWEYSADGRIQARSEDGVEFV